jgi:hypothetical protein
MVNFKYKILNIINFFSNKLNLKLIFTVLILQYLTRYLIKFLTEQSIILDSQKSLFLAFLIGIIFFITVITFYIKNNNKYFDNYIVNPFFIMCLFTLILSIAIGWIFVFLCFIIQSLIPEILFTSIASYFVYLLLKNTNSFNISNLK